VKHYTITIRNASYITEHSDIYGDVWLHFRIDDDGIIHRLPNRNGNVTFEVQLPEYMHGAVYRDKNGNFWMYYDPAADGDEQDPYFLTFGNKREYPVNYLDDLEPQLVDALEPQLVDM
jgi:hypothetical protein